MHLSIELVRKLNLRTVKTRFFVSVATNIFRAGISFATGILIARGLSPIGYGDLSFLLGSFVAIRSLLDMGSSSAFYTFLSQHSRDRRFYLRYFTWMALQFVVTLSLVALLIPAELFTKIWVGHSRGIVTLAFFAAFMQQHVWQMVNKIGEAARETVKVQLLNIAIAITNLTLIWLILLYGVITIELVLQLLIMQYTVATIMAYWLLRGVHVKTAVETEVTTRQMFAEFANYCRPLFGLTVIGFLYVFTNNWLLQKFGGAAQQGYFQVAMQFAQVSLIATASIVNIFWKEIADAIAKGDHSRVARLYQKINRGLVMLSAIATGLLLPWSEQIVMTLLGAAYLEAWPVLAIMLLYPIHQSMGQIGGTMLLASSNTRKYMVVSIFNMFVSLPFAYLVLAPTSNIVVPGLALGSIGFACYTVISNVIGVNIQAWVIARNGGWKLDWTYQMVGIPLMIVLGFLVKFLVGLYWNLEGLGISQLIVPAIITGLIYTIFATFFIWLFPWLIGSDREEIHKISCAFCLMRNIKEGV